MRISFELNNLNQCQKIRNKLVDNGIVFQFEKREDKAIISGEFSKINSILSM